MEHLFVLNQEICIATSSGLVITDKFYANKVLTASPEKLIVTISNLVVRFGTPGSKLENARLFKIAPVSIELNPACIVSDQPFKPREEEPV